MFVGLARARGAASAVEAGFLLLPLFMFIYGICEFGRALWTQSALQYAVEAAARCAAVNPSSCANVPSYAATQAYGLTIPSQDFIYSSGASCGITGYTKGSQVTASYAFRPLVTQTLVPLSVTLSAKSCHP